MSGGALRAHVAALHQCRLCPRMESPPVSGGPVQSEVMLVGQAPGRREPLLGRPFAWTAGKTLFRWFGEACGFGEEVFRANIYMAAVCRCFPGKHPKGSGDRVPDEDEIANCARWLDREISLLKPKLVIPVGKLAIAQFTAADKLSEVVGRRIPIDRASARFDLVALPHPSGASTWHRTEPGKTLLAHALAILSRDPSLKKIAAKSPGQPMDLLP
ncbi:MAG: uracil-DNA glycosylase family protein [Chthoniobacterales bacterium]|nr:uracil-DNA glycosylase family protein [Chthoniobacterales bacterium]